MRTKVTDYWSVEHEIFKIGEDLYEIVSSFEDGVVREFIKSAKYCWFKLNPNQKTYSVVLSNDKPDSGFIA